MFDAGFMGLKLLCSPIHGNGNLHQLRSRRIQWQRNPAATKSFTCRPNFARARAAIARRQSCCHGGGFAARARRRRVGVGRRPARGGAADRGRATRRRPCDIHRAGIEIRLAPGWKTYWRYPGDSGIPPRFDFSHSTNVKSVTVRYPAPQRLTDESGTSIGYKHGVVFPLEIVPQDAAQAGRACR